MIGEEINVKHGASFVMGFQYVDTDGVTPISLVGKTITSQVRDRNDVLVETLSITITNAALGQFTVSSAGTNLWPEVDLLWDIRITDGTYITISETAVIKVSKAVTRI